MISKGYHYVINLGIACNFCISIDPVYPGFCARRSISVNLSDTFKTQINKGKQSFCVVIFRREKDWAQPIISYMVFLIKFDMNFSWNLNVFVSVSAKLKCQILFQGISDASKIDIYPATTNGNSEKKSSLIQLHISFYNED